MVLAKKITKKLGKTAAYPANGKKVRNFGPVGRLIILVGLLVASALIVAGGFRYWAGHALPVGTVPIEFQVPPGASLSTVIVRMQDAGIGVAEAPFKLLARFRGVSGKIKPGIYAITSAPSPDELLDKIVRGQVAQVDVVIPEGWSFRQLRARLDAQPDIEHRLAGLSDAEVLRLVGATEKHPEGLFFPDTYRVDKASSDLALLQSAYQAMQGHLAQAWQSRAADSPLTSPYQALILASIIEKETGRADDRAQVGAVFVNRLRRGMLLQTDPTVIYGMGLRFDGNLRKRDLLADTPYNTYLRPGLPPTPIALPGRASLDAAVRPASSDALYFVARGDGSSEFSATLDAHNRAVNRYQRGGK